MSRHRALDDSEAIAAEQWFSEYQRVGTFQAKCRELQVTPNTLRDAVRRVRGEDTKSLRRKLTSAEINDLVSQIHVEPAQTGEKQPEDSDST